MGGSRGSKERRKGHESTKVNSNRARRQTGCMKFNEGKLKSKSDSTNREIRA